MKLPPPSLRAGGKAWHEDSFYLDVTDSDVHRMVEHAGLTVHSSFLDLGCGSGRHAVGLIRRFGRCALYLGIDVRLNCIEWARQNIAARYETFCFQWLDLPNDRYNPQGQDRFDAADILPKDVVNAWSFFTHQSQEDARMYLKAIATVLAPAGRAHVTAAMTPRAEGGVSYSEKPLLRVAYEDDHWRQMIDEAGLEVENAWYDTLPGKQSAFILRHK